MTDRRDALDDLFSVVYEELRRLASAVRRGEASETLNPTALVNEAYLKLAASLRFTPESRGHFKRLAVRAMRQVLVEAARRRHAERRGGGLALVTLDEALGGGDARSEDVLALDEALDDLARVDPHLADVVQYRFFGGFDVAETAEALGVSVSTVGRDWRLARAWLVRQLDAPPAADARAGMHAEVRADARAEGPPDARAGAPSHPPPA